MVVAMKSKGAGASVDPGRLPEHDAGDGQRGDHQPVPVGQHLVVGPGRTRPRGPPASRAQAAASRAVAYPRSSACAVVRLETIEDSVAFPVALGVTS